MVRGETDKTASDIQADHLWPELWIKKGRNAKLKERHQCSDEKPNYTKMPSAVEHGETCGMIPLKPKRRIKMRTSIQHCEPPSLDLPEWLEEFAENFVEDEAPVSGDAPKSISCESLHQELPRKVVSG